MQATGCRSVVYARSNMHDVMSGASTAIRCSSLILSRLRLVALAAATGANTPCAPGIQQMHGHMSLSALCQRVM
jgi:hypothetical protein